MGRLSHLSGIIHLLNPMVPCGTVTHVPAFCDLSTGCRRNALKSWNKLMKCPVPFPWHIRCSMEWPAEYGIGNRDHDKRNRSKFRSPCKATRHWKGRFRRQSATRRRMCPDPANCAPCAQVMSLLVGAERRSRDPAGFLLLKFPKALLVSLRVNRSSFETRLQRRPDGFLQRQKGNVSPSRARA